MPLKQKVNMKMRATLEAMTAEEIHHPTIILIKKLA